ncbi:MAG: hypothetical protein BMS9Abin31_0700 [Gammaproteobacteria bacterium]|nr:MAG: hypothetical protein BMS9Abin31_0700 [Gammaproteobacteria bacterium]
MSENAEILTEEVLLERDSSIMTDEIAAAKGEDVELGDEVHNDANKPEENPQEKEPEIDEIKEKRQTKFEKRIGRMTKKQRDTERRLEAVEEENRKLRDKFTAEPEESKTDSPKEEDFETYTEFVDELSKFNAKQAVEVTDKETTQQEVNDEPDIIPAVASQINDILADGESKYNDFNDVVRNPDLKLTNEILVEVIETDSPDEILYFLGKNPDEVDRLNDLTPKAKAREIAKIEAKLDNGELETDETVLEDSEEEPEKQKPTRRQSKAPEPISTIDGEGQHSEKSLNKMTTSEFRAARMKQIKARGGR